jgi:hypothetical protein
VNVTCAREVRATAAIDNSETEAKADTRRMEIVSVAGNVSRKRLTTICREWTEPPSLLKEAFASCSLGVMVSVSQ